MPSNILTLYFAGSGHGLDHKDDTMVEAYKRTKGAALFFPGPGGSDTNIYRKNIGAFGLVKFSDGAIGKNTKSDGKLASAQKRAATGKGWNRNVWYALKEIATYLATNKGNVTLNFAGHSRGSITIIMLLNDLFHQHVPVQMQNSFEIASTVKGTKTYSNRAQKDAKFDDWYKLRLKKIFTDRMGSDKDAEEGIRYLEVICSNKNRLSCNVWLFDPVGGLNQGNSTRKQEFPEHAQIKRVRVMRMEQGGVGGTLSTNMPTFKGKHNWVFLDGTRSRNLATFEDVERLVIPMPGTHGAGLSLNGGLTGNQQYIGTGYMISLLEKCGTQFDDGFKKKYGIQHIVHDCYDQLYSDFYNIAPGKGDNGWGKARQAIHTHHKVDQNGIGHYAGNAVNAHHRFLNNMRSTPTKALL